MVGVIGLIGILGAVLSMIERAKRPPNMVDQLLVGSDRLEEKKKEIVKFMSVLFVDTYYIWNVRRGGPEFVEAQEVAAVYWDIEASHTSTWGVDAYVRFLGDNTIRVNPFPGEEGTSVAAELNDMPPANVVLLHKALPLLLKRIRKGVPEVNKYVVEPLLELGRVKCEKEQH